MRPLRTILVASSDEGTVDVVERGIAGAADAAATVIRANERSEALEVVATTGLDAAIVAYELPPAATGLDVLRHMKDVQPRCLRVLIPGELNLENAIATVNRGEVDRLLPSPIAASAIRHVILGAAGVSLNVEASTHLALPDLSSDALRRAYAELMHGGALRLALQPLACAICRSELGYEAFLRSNHPILKGPREVFAAALRLGTLHDLGQVLSWLAQQRIANLPPRVLFFMNLYPSELTSPELLLQRMAPLLPYSGRMVFELADCAAVPSLERWRETAQLLHQGGFKLSIDDLSTGYGSMTLLAHARPHFIKTPISLVRGIEADPQRQRLLRHLVNLGTGIRALVVAKGVESEAEAQTVHACGVRVLQGFLTGRARDVIDPKCVPDEDMESHVAAQSCDLYE